MPQPEARKDASSSPYPTSTRSQPGREASTDEQEQLPLGEDIHNFNESRPITTVGFIINKARSSGISKRDPSSTQRSPSSNDSNVSDHDYRGFLEYRLVHGVSGDTPEPENMPELTRIMNCTGYSPAPDKNHIQSFIRRLTSGLNDPEVTSDLAFGFLPIDDIMDNKFLLAVRSKSFDSGPELPTPQPDLAIGYKGTHFNFGVLQRLDALPCDEVLAFAAFFVEAKGKGNLDAARSHNLHTGAMAPRNLHALFTQAGQEDKSYDHAQMLSADSNAQVRETLRSWAVEDPRMEAFKEARQAIRNVALNWLLSHYEVFRSATTAFEAAEAAARSLDPKNSPVKGTQSQNHEYSLGSRLSDKHIVIRGNLSSTPISYIDSRIRPLKKRATDFNYYACKGGVQWESIQAAWKNTPASGPTFSDDDLKDGWSRNEEDKSQFMSWYGPLQENVGRRPKGLDIQHIKLKQDKAFHNAAGELVQEFLPKAMYFAFYLPSFSAVIAININSPKNQLLRKFPGPLQLSPQDIARRVPRLNRFSDVIWKVWTQLVPPGDAKKLRYVAHSFITNDVTVDIINQILNVRYRGEKAVPWPGMEFGLDSREGRALLATPNGVGVYRLLIDRARELGRREARVIIFTGWEGPYDYCMLWDLRPV
ncbi:MAG: hypothetical protein Q9170_007001 [Blastenia crenularia]